MFVFKTKAQNLEQIQDLNPEIVVPRFVHFDRGEWLADARRILLRAQEQLEGPVIVRSSAIGEDGAGSSLAGAFDSYRVEDVSDGAAVEQAVEGVWASITTGRLGMSGDRVLIQELAKDVAISGVIFSRDLATGSPYIVVNYDDSSGATDTVTAGRGMESGRTLWVFRDALEKVRSERFRQIIANFLWLEEATKSQTIDVEFAIDHQDRFLLLQVRPLSGLPDDFNEAQTINRELLATISGFCEDVMSERSGLLGRKSALGQMPDWNPAEVIGRAPKRLARQLYENLVTDEVWARARCSLGYRDVSAHPLMLSLAGQPFIDVRVSFNSFIPSDLSAEMGSRLVDAWMDRLILNPHLHDKVEFDVATPSFRFDLEDFYRNNYSQHFLPEELLEYFASLRAMTLVHVRDTDLAQERASRAIDQLQLWQMDHARYSSGRFPISQALSICRSLGTEPFALHARHAFAAKVLLKSLESRQLLDSTYVDRLQSKIKTVASEFTEAIKSASSPEFVDRLLESFGHLRPGTYEVSSLRYDEMPRELFLDSARKGNPNEQRETAELGHEVEELQRALDIAGEREFGAEELVKYFTNSTKERERAKFVFSRTVSDVLSAVRQWSLKQSLSPEDASYLSLLSLLSDEREVHPDGSTLSPHDDVTFGRSQYRATRSIRLPVLICDPEDVWVVPVLVSQPNFIGQFAVTAPLVFLKGSSLDLQIPLQGAVVAIESADPGFDWLFMKEPAGLITRFGGTNSHMAIRCAELGVPAAIGCGEELFERLITASTVELDCNHRSVRPIH